MRAYSFENYIAEKAFTDRFVQQSPSKLSNFIEKFVNEIILEIDKNSNNLVSEERTKNEEFQSRNSKRWHELFRT